MHYKRFAIADIHGCSTTLMALLSSINLQPYDKLIVLGDSIDRGPESRSVLDTLMRLVENGYDIVVLRGNHEDMLLRTLSGNHDGYSSSWIGWWGERTLNSFGVSSPSDIPGKYIDFINSMPLYHETVDYIFVHASLLISEKPVIETPPQIMLWGQQWLGREALPCGRRIVSGHQIVSRTTLQETLSSHHFLIDNGCFCGRGPEKGNLVALNLDTLEVTAQPLIDRDCPF